MRRALGILYDPTSGVLSYDADGQGGTATSVASAVLANPAQAPTADDFVVI